MLNYSANGPSGYNLTNSLRFRSSATAYLSRTPSSSGNQQKYTWSAWVKLGAIQSGSLFGGDALSSRWTEIVLTSSNTIQIYSFNTTLVASLITTQVFRDPSAWYHIVMAVDTTQATAANRIILYINGQQVTSFSTATYPSQNANLAGINQTVLQSMGKAIVQAGAFDGYMTEVNFIDGQALTPSSFGNTNSATGVWQPAKYTGTYGTNGFYLNFSNIALTSGSNTGLGKDYSGNGNYWNTNNISVTSGTTYDAMTDVPTLTSTTIANYSTLNPLQKGTNCATVDANLKTSLSGANGWDKAIVGTQVISSKAYWEIVDQCSSIGAFGNQGFGIVAANVNINVDPATSTNFITFRDYDGQFYNATVLNPAGSGAPFGSGSTNDIYMFAYDPSTTKLWAGRNGTWFNSGNPAAGTGAISSTNLGDVLPVIRAYQSGDGPATINFGQRPFAYTAPTGFLPLNTYNLPTSTIVQGNKYMDATLYTGTGSARSVTNAYGFKPDLVWVKDRSVARSNVLVDSNRGATKVMYSNNTNAEITDATSLTAFNSNGFSVGSDNGFNANGETFVGWQWQAGQGTNTTNTSGSITSTVSVNASAGFSIITYTGNGVANATVGHGLGVQPNLIIVKQRTGTADNWAVSVKLSNLTVNRMYLNSNIADNGLDWVGASSTLLTLKLSDNFVNANGNTYVSYCWASIAGFSKIGSYTGNGSTDGTFVYTGFKPKYLMVKCSSNGSTNWVIVDTSRNTYNVTNLSLDANNADAEQTGTSSTMPTMDLLSNGFKIRTTSIGGNGNGYTYIYMAFAENPFKNALAR